MKAKVLATLMVTALSVICFLAGRAIQAEQDSCPADLGIYHLNNEVRAEGCVLVEIGFGYTQEMCDHSARKIIGCIYQEAAEKAASKYEALERAHQEAEYQKEKAARVNPKP